MKVQNKISKKLFDKQGGKFMSKYELSPCVGGLIGRYNGSVLDSVYLLDLVGSGDRVAEKSISTYFDGATYIDYDLTGYEHLNAECHDIEIEFYNNVVLNKSTTGQILVHIGTAQLYNGIAFGDISAGLTDEIISTLSGSDGRSGYTSSSAEIAVGRHTLSLLWNTNKYDIYLDGVKINNAVSGTGSVFVLNRIRIGLNAAGLRPLSNTYLYNCTIKDESGQVIFKDSLAAGAGNKTNPDIGPPGTITGYTGTPWNESVVFGYDWNKVPHFEGENTVLQSENLMVTPWSLAAGATLESEGIVGPFSNEAFSLNNNGSSFKYIAQIINDPTGVEFERSVCLKNVSGEGIATVTIFQNGTTDVVSRVLINLVTGELNITEGEWTSEYLGDGWWRVKTVVTFDYALNRLYVYAGTYSQPIAAKILISAPQSTRYIENYYLRTEASSLSGKFPVGVPTPIGDTRTGVATVGANIEETVADTTFTALATGTGLDQIIRIFTDVPVGNSCLMKFRCTQTGKMLKYYGGLWSSEFNVEAGNSYSIPLDVVAGMHADVRLSEIGTQITDVSIEYYPQIEEGQSVLGTPLNRPGTAKNNMNVFGYTGDWDGLTRGYLSEDVVISGDFEIHFKFSISDASAWSGLFGGVGATENRLGYSQTGGILYMYDNGFYIGFEALPVEEGVLYVAVLKRVGYVYTLTINGDSQSKTSTYKSDWNFGVIGSMSSASAPLRGTLEYLKILQNGALLNHLVVESSPTNEQTTIYDIVGGNHAALTGATLPFFTERKAGSELFARGFSDGLVDNIELWDNDELIPTASFNVVEDTIVLTGTTGFITLQTPPSVIGKAYRVAYIIELSAGAIQFQVGGANDDAYNSTNNGTKIKTLVAINTNTARFFSNLGVGTVKVLYLYAIADGLVPASLTNPDQDVFGNVLTNEPGQVYGAPIELEAPDSQELYAADQTDFGDGAIDVWFEADGTKNALTPDDLAWWGYGPELWDAANVGLGLGWSDLGDNTYSRTDEGTLSQVYCPTPEDIPIGSVCEVTIEVLVGGTGALRTWVNGGSADDYTYFPDEVGIHTVLVTTVIGSSGGIVNFRCATTNYAGTFKVLSVRQILGDKGSINNQYFYDGEKNLLLYEQPIVDSCLNKTKAFIGA